LPKTEGQLPNLEGRLSARGPIPLVNRAAAETPLLEGWAAVDIELHYTPETPIPDLAGRVEIHDVRVARFNFAKNVTSEIAVRRGVVMASVTKLDIAGSATELHDVEVRPLEKGLPIRIGRLDVKSADFTTMLRDFHVHPRPFVSWDIREVHVTDMKGTAEPLNLVGDLSGKTYDFNVFPRP
jgi:hypothetical protein